MITASGAENDNYTIQYAEGDFEITKATIASTPPAGMVVANRMGRSAAAFSQACA